LRNMPFTRFSALLVLLFPAAICIAQEAPLYDPSADASAAIAMAVKKAAAENKFVLVQAGGNWCGWCREFERLTKNDAAVDSIMRKWFVVVHLNWSKENRNREVFARYGFPERFGFPVFLVLNAKGERIHTQNSEYLEDGKKSYDHRKVIDFLDQWSPKAVFPGT
jgi:thiol:disulfide interchange protein